ncbi:MAG: hypothetical protein ACRC26_06785 [Bacteroidales bacterium]
MGLAKEQYDIIWIYSDRKIASHLGLTYEEFAEYHTEVDTDESSEGLIYNYIVRFSDEIPQEIWDKIKGDKGDYCVFITAHVFENL